MPAALREKIYFGFRAFYKFLVAKGLRNRETLLDLDDLKPVRIYEEDRPYLTEDGLIKLLETNRNTLTGRLKDRVDYDIQLTEVIIYLTGLVGLRREEVLNLEVGHIDLNRQELMVIDGKGNKNRPVGFNEEVRDAILIWLKKYRPKTKYPNLLVRANGLPLTEDMVYKRIRRMSKQAGTPINPHGLRRTCASVAIEHGVNLHHVSEILGHTRTSTTEKSYVRISKRQAVNSFKNLRLNTEKTSPAEEKLSELRAFQAIDEF